MTITARLFATTPGAYSFSSADLANVVILCVCRQGLGYDCVVGTGPGNREARYDNGAGSLTFQNAFTGPGSGSSSDVDPPEEVYVRYKY